MNSMPFTIRIETIGCRLNQTESEALFFIFLQEGFSIFKEKDTQKKDDVCLCILNTCTVTSKAEQKARRLIRHLLKTHIKACILVTGCYAELERNAIEAIDSRVIAFPGKKKDDLVFLASYIKKKMKEIQEKKSLNTETLKNIIMSFRIFCNNKVAHNEEYPSMGASIRNSMSFVPTFALSSPTFMLHSRATLKVQDGCNNSCTFCRIRIARGKAVSLASEEVVRRLQEIEKKGYKEVVITGVNLSQYKSDKKNFSDLLELLIEKTSNIKIRISSLYPESINEKLLLVIANERICPHFHLSIQSGNDEILKKMGRSYKKYDIYRAVERLREAKDAPFIGCDIITGFPSETEEAFLDTFDMCRALKFAGIHAFPFSPRPNTSAFFMKHKVSNLISTKRVARLNALAKKNYTQYLDSCNGKSFFAIIEAPYNASFFVTSENYLHLPLISKKPHKPADAVYIEIQGNMAIEKGDIL